MGFLFVCFSFIQTHNPISFIPNVCILMVVELTFVLFLFAIVLCLMSIVKKIMNFLLSFQ